MLPQLQPYRTQITQDKSGSIGSQLKITLSIGCYHGGSCLDSSIYPSACMEDASNYNAASPGIGFNEMVPVLQPSEFNSDTRLPEYDWL